MLDGLSDAEMHDFLVEYPTIVPLFEIDVLPAVEPNITTDSKPDELHEPDPASL